MGKFIKYLLGAIAILIALIIIAIIVFSLTFNPNEYKDEIKQFVKETTGRKLTIGGEINLSFFPYIGVETSHVTLSNAEGFPKPKMLKVEHIGVAVKLLPLLSGEIVLDTIYLKNAVIHLAKNAQGVTNWQGLLPKGQKQPTAEPPPEEPAGTGIAGLVIAGVQLEDSKITWSNLGTDTHYAATGIDLTTSKITFGKPFHLHLGFDLVSEKSGLDARVNLDTTVTVGESFQTAQLTDLKLTVEGQYSSGPGEPIPLEVTLTGDAAVHLAAGTAQISNLVVHAWNVTAKGQLTASNLTTNLTYQGSLTVPEFSPEELLTILTGSAPETSDPAVLESAGLQLTFQGTADSLHINLEKAYLDDSHLSGEFGIQDFATMAIVFDLQLDGINVDHYLPPSKKQAQNQTKVATPGEAVATGGAMIPVDVLRGLNLHGSLHVGSLTVMDLTATDIDLTIDAANGKLRIHPLNAKMYSGTYQGDIRIDATGPKPILHMDESIQGVKAGPLLKDMTGKTWLTGTGSLTLQTTANLSSPKAAKRSLSGTFRMSFKNGAVFGINIPLLIRQAVAAFQNLTLNPEVTVKKTDFSSLTVAAEITDGTFHIKPISLKSPLLRVSGSGIVNLPKMQMDVTIKPVLVKSLEGQGGVSLKQLIGIPIPLHISGDLLSPDIDLNLEAALKERVKDKLKEELREELGEELGGLGLFSGGESATPEGTDKSAADSSGEKAAAEEKPSVEEQLKRKALDAIFGG